MTSFPTLSAPARSAFYAAGYTRLDQLAEAPEAGLRQVHGMGPTAIAAVDRAFHERGLSLGALPPAPRRRDPSASAAAAVDEYHAVSTSRSAARGRRSSR
jgi:hypothetical protein